MGLAPIVALEIGTSKVLALVGELREDNHIVITGMGEHASAGVRKGEMVDFENARICVKAALGAAEETAQVAIHQIHLALSGGTIETLVNRGTVPITSPSEGVTRDDVEQVTELARAVNLPPDRQILHSIGQIFYVDGERVARPENFECSTLALDMLILHAQSSHIRNTVRLLRNDLQMDVVDTAFGGLCSALAVLTPEQKEGGVLVIDLGGGTTTYTAYAAGTFAAAGAYTIGGDHVTNDIALAFNIPRSQADHLKCERGSAIAEDAGGPIRIDLPAEVGYPGRNISLSGLHTVIHLRMVEIFQLILREIERKGIVHQIGAGVVLTGGGAQMKGLIKLAERVFRLPCMIGRPIGFSGLAAAVEKPECSTAAGLLRYAFKNAASAHRGHSLWTRFTNIIRGR
ncbi:MAG: cell division protein FtsA [bacterium]